MGDSDDKEDDEAEEVEGCILDVDDAGEGGGDLLNSDFTLDVAPNDMFNGRYLTLCWEEFCWFWAPTSLPNSERFLVPTERGGSPPSSDVSEPVELEHFCNFSFIISSLTTRLQKMIT